MHTGKHRSPSKQTTMILQWLPGTSWNHLNPPSHYFNTVAAKCPKNFSTASEEGKRNGIFFHDKESMFLS